MFDLTPAILLMQTIPGLPPTLISGDNAKPIIEAANHVWSACFFLLGLLTVVGLYVSQYQWIAKKTGGPGQFLHRAISVGFTLAGYKIIFALIMWSCAFAAYKIYPNATADAWIPVGGSLSKYASFSKISSTYTTVSNSANPTPPPDQKTDAKTSPLEVIMWGLSNAYGMTFQALPAMLVIMLCNIFFILGVFIISAFWLTFAVILYALGPLMITAGLVPEYGDKIWGHWIGATIQCGLWQVWMAFCALLLTTPFFTQLSHLNPDARQNAVSGGGDLSGALMDVQQAAYSVTFLFLYLATPFVVNYIFPIGASGNMGGFMLGAASSMISKGVRTVSAIKTGGMSEAVKQGASTGIKQTTAQAGSIAASSAMNSGATVASSSAATNQAGGQGYRKAPSSNNGNSSNSGQSSSQSTYDGTNRNSEYTNVQKGNGYSVGTQGGNQNSGVKSHQNTGENSNYALTNQNSVGSQVNAERTESASSAQNNWGKSESGSAGTAGNGSQTQQTVYRESATKPPGIKFGKLPETNNNGTVENTSTSQRADEEKSR